MIAWIGLLAFALQIYFDFSAYSDMAIGLGRIFGFHFLENFDYPYMAVSLSDFWRRWHKSLSAWFKDYVYIPLGGNRVSKRRYLINMFIVWFLTGIWHGAEWTFILWGLFFFVVLVVEKKTGFVNKLGIFKRGYTLLIVLFSWVLFRSENLVSALNYYKSLLGLNGNGFSNIGVILSRGDYLCVCFLIDWL